MTHRVETAATTVPPIATKVNTQVISAFNLWLMKIENCIAPLPISN